MPLDTRRLADLASHDAFIQRHNGPSQADVAGMLDQLGTDSIATLIEKTVPSAIRLGRELDLPTRVVGLEEPDPPEEEPGPHEEEPGPPEDEPDPPGAGGDHLYL